MAKIQLVSDVMPNLLPMQGRSKGIHISDIASDLCIRLGHWAPSEEFNQSQLELGNAFEWAIIERMMKEYPDRYIHLGELTKDGIHGTPDLYDMGAVIRKVEYPPAIDEMKCTWMSMRTATPGSTKFWKYEFQIKSYCCMMEVGRAYLNVLFVNGDYTFGKTDGKVGPSRFMRYQYDFMAAELKQHWTVVRRHAEP